MKSQRLRGIIRSFGKPQKAIPSYTYRTFLFTKHLRDIFCARHCFRISSQGDKVLVLMNLTLQEGKSLLNNFYNYVVIQMIPAVFCFVCVLTASHLLPKWQGLRCPDGRDSTQSCGLLPDRLPRIKLNLRISFERCVTLRESSLLLCVIKSPLEEERPLGQGEDRAPGSTSQAQQLQVLCPLTCTSNRELNSLYHEQIAKFPRYLNEVMQMVPPSRDLTCGINKLYFQMGTYFI